MLCVYPAVPRGDTEEGLKVALLSSGLVSHVLLNSFAEPFIQSTLNEGTFNAASRAALQHILSRVLKTYAVAFH